MTKKHLNLGRLYDPKWPPWCLISKESACNAGDSGLIPELGRSPGEGIGYQCQYSCLGNPIDKGARWATVHEATKSQT